MKNIDTHIVEFKNLQEKHRLFLDLEEDEVRKKYWEIFPKGTNYANFLGMISGMSKEDNAFNYVFIEQMCTAIRKFRKSIE